MNPFNVLNSSRLPELFLPHRARFARKAAAGQSVLRLTGGLDTAAHSKSARALPALWNGKSGGVSPCPRRPSAKANRYST
eukprot:6967294-Alexandrium_andersonii.AAC.1